MNTTGYIFRLTTFGESHGPATGGVIDGMIPGFRINFDHIRQAIAARKPGAPGTTGRREADEPEFLSGLLDGVTLGTPIAFIVRNSDTRSSDYEELRHTFRPNHADYTYEARYGIRDWRGGGRASARETLARVIAGAIAEQVLNSLGITIEAYVDNIGGSADATAAIEEARRDADTLGGAVGCIVRGVPAGIGAPVFGKLQASLAAAMMSIPAAKAFEYGDGTLSATMRGSESLDDFTFTTNHSGGIQGGISNGADITMKVTFKPIASLPGREVNTINDKGERTTLKLRGRHDVSAVPRAVPVVKAMAAITILDHLLVTRTLH